MSVKLKELKDILDLAKQYGLSSVKVGTIEATFKDIPYPPHAPTPQQDFSEIAKQLIGSDQGYPTDEELLYHSSGYVPSIKAERPE